MKWKNIPIPEGYLVPLILGVALQIVHPLYLTSSPWVLVIIGAFTLISGLLLVGWSVRDVDPVEVDSPERLISSGPYRFSRNPMYLAWSLILMATAFLMNNLWLLLLFPLVLVYTHFFVILPEEKALEDRFGTQYKTYKSKVRRHLQQFLL